MTEKEIIGAGKSPGLIRRQETQTILDRKIHRQKNEFESVGAREAASLRACFCPQIFLSFRGSNFKPR
jgi:hypothetical protein